MKKRSVRMCGVALSLAVALSLPIPAFASDAGSGTMSAKATKISAYTAKLKALKVVGGGKVYRCAMEYDDGRQEYEVIVVRGYREYEMDFAVYGGAMNDYSVDRMITKTSAKKIAVRRAGGGKTTSCVTAYAYGELVYKINVKRNGKIHRMSIETDDGGVRGYKAPAGTSSSSSAVTLAKAKSIALSTVGGGKVIRTETDIDDGLRVYEIRVLYNGMIHEVTINARTGRVIDYDIDD